MKANIYIVEDEAIPRAYLENLLQVKGYNVVGSSATASKALAEIAALKIDLLLLDIKLLTGKDGIWIAEQMQAQGIIIPTIFLTAYNDKDTLSRLKSTQPVGYIKKPFDETTLLVSIDLALSNTRKTNHPEMVENDSIFIKDGYKKSRIHIPDIVYIKSDGNYLRIVLQAATYFIRGKLSDILKQTENHKIVQIHRSVAINVNHIDQIDKDIIRLGSNEFKISRTFKQAIEAHV